MKTSEFFKVASVFIASAIAIAILWVGVSRYAETIRDPFAPLNPHEPGYHLNRSARIHYNSVRVSELLDRVDALETRLDLIENSAITKSRNRKTKTLRRQKQ